MQSLVPVATVAFSTLPLDVAPDGLFGTPLGSLLVAIVALAVIVLVGRVVLDVAWKLLVAAGVVVGLLYLLSLLGV